MISARLADVKFYVGMGQMKAVLGLRGQLVNKRYVYMIVYILARRESWAGEQREGNCTCPKRMILMSAPARHSLLIGLGSSQSLLSRPQIPFEYPLCAKARCSNRIVKPSGWQ